MEGLDEGSEGGVWVCSGEVKVKWICWVLKEEVWASGRPEHRGEHTQLWDVGENFYNSLLSADAVLALFL